LNLRSFALTFKDIILKQSFYVKTILRPTASGGRFPPFVILIYPTKLQKKCDNSKF